MPNSDKSTALHSVSRDEFWAFVMGAKYNITSSVEGNWPYTTLFKRGESIVGKIVGHERAGQEDKEYFLKEADHAE